MGNGGFAIFMKIVGLITLLVSLILSAVGTSGYDTGDNINPVQYNNLALILAILGVAAFCGAMNRPLDTWYSKAFLVLGYACWLLGLIFGIMSASYYDDNDAKDVVEDNKNILKYQAIGMNFSILSIGFFVGGLTIGGQ